MIEVVFHCSGSRAGNAALFAKWHTSRKEDGGRGWNNIGYHYVILNGWLAPGAYNKHFNGHIETGRPLDDDPFFEKSERGAHAKAVNHKTIGICFVGDSGKFTDEQLNSGIELCFMLDKQFGGIKLNQHSEYEPNKPYCAGLDIELFRKNYSVYRESIKT